MTGGCAMTLVLDVAGLPLERLEAEICELAAHQAAAECRMLRMLAEFDRREGWSAGGIQSCAHWLSWRTGIGVGAAREKVRVAHRLVEMPLVEEAFARGELSYSKVRALARAVEPSTEAMLLEVARTATTAQLETILRSYRRATGDEERADDRERRQRRYCRWYWDEDGSLVIEVRLSPEDGAQVMAAIEAEMQQIRAVLSQAADRPQLDPESLRADAFAAMARAALAATGQEAAALPTVVVHADAAALSGSDGPGRCHLDNGPALLPETARRLACDATIYALLTGPDGNALDIGRKSRTVPPPMRRAVMTRAAGVCQFPGCTSRRYLQAHHVVWWRNGGHTKFLNLIALCTHHHHAVHEGGFGVTSPQPHVFVFTDPHGRVIPAIAPPLELTGPTLEAQSAALSLDIHPGTCRSLGEGERFDLADTVEALINQAAANRTLDNAAASLRP